ncbi:MAG: hypothetical protein Q9191_002275 [Dirinaria sp. TL-2023a]
MTGVNEQARALAGLNLDHDTTEERVSTTDEKPSHCCRTCGKTEEAFGAPLRTCSKCNSTRYCNRKCERKDWKTHKLTCDDNKPKDTPETPPANGTKKKKGSAATLHQLPEQEVYTYLIDAYRMRVEDEYVFTGEVGYDSLYGGGEPIKDFRRFLTKAEKRPGLLPPWWCAAKRKECERVAVDESQWSCLSFAVEKSDVQEHYDDPGMPLQLRMFAQRVYGKPVC